MPNNNKHGMWKHRLYRIYNNMKSRCFNKNNTAYRNYGERGITVCDSWIGENGFVNFKEWAFENGYSDELTLDRIDNNGNYCPENCRWITFHEQQKNKRITRKVVFGGKEMCARDFAMMCTECEATVYKKLRNGVRAEEIIDSVGCNKKCYLFDTQTGNVLEFKTTREAADFLGVTVSSVRKVCNGYRKTIKKYIARRENIWALQ